MALPVNRPFNMIRVHAHLADHSAAGSAFAIAPTRGKIVKLGIVTYVAVSGAPNVLTAKIAGTAITIPTWTTTTTAGSGGTAGDKAEVTPSGANLVNDGDNIEFISDGAGSSTCPCMFYADILVG